jgi:hypothetical protein
MMDEEEELEPGADVLSDEELEDDDEEEDEIPALHEEEDAM